MKVVDDIAALGGVAGLAGIAGWVSGWWLKRERKDASLRALVERETERLIKNLREDCAGARTDARDAKEAVERCEAKHADCERKQDELQAQIDRMLRDGGVAPYHLGQPKR